MRSLVPAALLAFAMPAPAQLLTCPPAATASTKACELFHYHVAMYRPDTRGFAEVWGTNQFASQAACDRAREAAMKRDLAIVDHMKRVAGDNNFESDRFGPCHCDGSLEPSSPTFLNDAQRTAQIRLAEEIRQRVRERLLDSRLTSDSELVRSLYPAPVPNAVIGGPKIVPPPQSAPVSLPGQQSDLRITKAIDASKPAVASVDLPLVDVVTGPPPPPQPIAAAPATPSAPAPAAELPTVTVEAPPAVTQAPPEPAVPDTSAEEAADNFVGYETQRIQNVLKAASSINDEAVKSKIFEACLQRTQLLSNLRALILGAGTRSRLAADAAAAKSESERVAFVSKLFGNDIAPHWAAKEATDVIIDAAPEDPEKVLRDKQTNDQQKRTALYFLLAKSQPTEEQQLWLSTLIDGLLQ